MLAGLHPTRACARSVILHGCVQLCDIKVLSAMHKAASFLFQPCWLGLACVAY